jgi:hypothetical protein
LREQGAAGARGFLCIINEHASYGPESCNAHGQQTQPACALALVVLKFLPNGPAQASFLSQAEKDTITARLAEERPASHTSVWPGIFDLRVLLLVDQDAPPAALQAVNSQAVRQWLDANCVQDAGRAEWRLWDRSAIESDGLDSAPEIWQKLWQDVRADLSDGPQAVIVRGTDATVIPIESQPQLLQALKQARGQ